MEFLGTKGHWQYRKYGYQKIKILGTKTKKVCEINCNNNNKIDSINVANALLISKAPEMLEMLNKIMNSYDTGTQTYLDCQQLIKEATELN